MGFQAPPRTMKAIIVAGTTARLVLSHPVPELLLDCILVNVHSIALVSGH